jgi:hypothetical protein
VAACGVMARARQRQERALSFKQAQACEFALEARCRCRCAGKGHGRARFVAELTRKDPYAVAPAQITLAELQRFFVVKLERRQGDFGF